MYEVKHVGPDDRLPLQGMFICPVDECLSTYTDSVSYVFHLGDKHGQVIQEEHMQKLRNAVVNFVKPSLLLMDDNGIFHDV